MKDFRFILLYICTASLANHAYAESARTSSVDAFGENTAREAVEKVLTEYGLRFEERSLLAEQGGFGVSVHVDLPSVTPDASSRGTLVIATPLSLGIKQTDDALDYGVRATLAFAQDVKKRGAPMNVRVAFLADEGSQLPADLRGKTMLGLRDLMTRYEEHERTAVVYLNMEKGKGITVLHHGSKDTVAPLEILSPLLKVFKSRELSLKLAVPYNELYRLGLISGPAALALLQEEGFPALFIDEWTKKADDGSDSSISSDVFGDILYDYAIKIGAVTEEADRRYSIFGIGEFVLPIPEGLSVALFILTAFIGLTSVFIYSLTHRHLLVARGKIFLYRAWVFPVFIVVLLACLYAANGILLFCLQTITRSAITPTYAMAALKMLLALSCYTLIAPLLMKPPFPRRAHFFGSASLTLLALGMLIAATLDFTFVPVFLWALAFSLASVAVRHSSTVLIFALLAPIQGGAAIIAAMRSGDDGTAKAFLSANPRVGFFLAFTTLPFLFLFRRAIVLSKRKGGFFRIRRGMLFRLGFFMAVIAMMLTYAFVQSKHIKSETPIVREYVEKEDSARKILDLDVSTTTFLDRRSVTIRLNATRPPVRFDLSAESEEAIAIYDVAIPYTLSDDGKQVTFVLGERPNNPLQLEIILPFSFRGTLKARALYIDPMQVKDSEGISGTTNENYALLVERTVPIGAEP